jgi:hypothetical protein
VAASGFQEGTKLSVLPATMGLMVSPIAAPSQLVIPADTPHSKFVRYARAVSKDYSPLFPITPATRPLVVGIDLRTLGPRPEDHEDLVHVLRRDEVTPTLMLFSDDDADVADAWLQACDVADLNIVAYTDPKSAGRMMDALEFRVSTMRGGQRRACRTCHTFDIYSVIDANHSPTTDLSVGDRVRAAVLAAAGYGLGTDVIVTLAPTNGRPDVGDNDIVTTITPDELHPVFGHYLRMTGNPTIAEFKFAGGVQTTRATIYGRVLQRRSRQPYPVPRHVAASCPAHGQG